MIRSIYFTLFFLILVSTFGLPHGQAADSTDPAVTALQTQQAEMDAKLKILQDQQAMLSGMLPSSTTTPNSGAFTVTGSNPFPSQHLAYSKLQSVAKDLATKINERTNGPILIYDQNEINTLVNYQALNSVVTYLTMQGGKLEEHFNDHLKTRAEEMLKFPQKQISARIAPILIPGLVLGGLKTASDLIGMFRTNTSISYNSYTVDDAALTAAVVNELISLGKTVYEPAAMPLNINAVEKSEFMNNLYTAGSNLTKLQNEESDFQVKIQHVSDALHDFIQADQASQDNKDQASAETDKNKKAALKAKQKSLDLKRDQTKSYVLELLNAPSDTALNATFAPKMKADRDNFLKELATFATSTASVAQSLGSLQTALMAVTTTGASTLTAILRAENLFKKVNNATFLLVKNSVLGGSVVTRTNLFSGGHLLYTGGAIANFTLFNSEGAVLASGVVVVEEEGKKEDKF